MGCRIGTGAFRGRWYMPTGNLRDTRRRMILLSITLMVGVKPCVILGQRGSPPTNVLGGGLGIDLVGPTIKLRVGRPDRCVHLAEAVLG